MDKGKLLDRAMRFPHVFKILPILEGKPTEQGTWAAYNHDEVTVLWVNTSHVEAQKFYSEQFKMKEESHMARELTVQEDQGVKNLIAKNIQAIKSVLPKHLTPERAARIAYTSLVKNPTLARCSQLSLMNAIIEASILGLEVGGPLRQATLIPFKNNKTNTYEATLVVEYGGMITLAQNTGNVKNISAHPVFEKDYFEYSYGLVDHISHKPCFEKDPGKLIHAYAIIRYMNGGYDFEVIGERVAMDAKDRSAAKFQKDSPWNKKEDEPAMWVKTAIRRLMNRVPKSAEIRNAMDVEDRSTQEMKHVIDISLDDFHSVTVPSLPASQGGRTTQPQQQQPATQPQQKQPVKQEPKINEMPEQNATQTSMSKAIMQAISVSKQFPEEFEQTCRHLNLGNFKAESWDDETAEKVCKGVSEMLDMMNM